MYMLFVFIWQEIIQLFFNGFNLNLQRVRFQYLNLTSFWICNFAKNFTYNFIDMSTGHKFDSFNKIKIQKEVKPIIICILKLEESLRELFSFIIYFKGNFVYIRNFIILFI